MLKIAAVHTFGLAASAAAAPPSYSVVGSYKGADGGWDILSVDPAAHRLYVARRDSVTAVDLAVRHRSPTSSRRPTAATPRSRSPAPATCCHQRQREQCDDHRRPHRQAARDNPDRQEARCGRLGSGDAHIVGDDSRRRRDHRRRSGDEQRRSRTVQVGGSLEFGARGRTRQALRQRRGPERGRGDRHTDPQAHPARAPARLRRSDRDCLRPGDEGDAVGLRQRCRRRALGSRKAGRIAHDRQAARRRSIRRTPALGAGAFGSGRHAVGDRAVANSARGPGRADGEKRAHDRARSLDRPRLPSGYRPAGAGRQRTAQGRAGNVPDPGRSRLRADRQARPRPRWCSDGVGA